jgi:AbrB family looped-hinge helix DNA binding protein
MSNTNRLNTKGQIVIPHRLRKRFGLVPGTPVTFLEEQGKLTLVKGGDSPVDQIAGCWKKQGLPGGLSADAFIEKLRGR